MTLHELTQSYLDTLSAGDSIARSHLDAALVRFNAELEAACVELGKRQQTQESAPAEARAQKCSRQIGLFG